MKMKLFEGKKSAIESRENQKGAVMIMVTVIISFSMIMMAFALDIGWILSTKSELQHGADAAALASVIKIMESGVTEEAVLADANTWADFNKAAGVSGQYIKDVQLGYIKNPLLPGGYEDGAFQTGESIPYANSVKVTSQVNTESKMLDLFMGAFTNNPSVNVEMTAIATIENRIFAPAPPPDYVGGNNNQGGGNSDGSTEGMTLFGNKMIPITMHAQFYYKNSHIDEKGDINKWFDNYKKNIPFYDKTNPKGELDIDADASEDPRVLDQYHYYLEEYDQYFAYEDRYSVDFSILDDLGYDTDADGTYVIPIDNNFKFEISDTGADEQDNIPEFVLYLHDKKTVDMPNGNWGTVTLGANNNSTAKIEAQIVNGVQLEELWETFPDGNMIGKTVNADPGKSLGFMDAFDDELKGNKGEGVKGKIRFFIMHSLGEGNGNNAEYTIVGVVPVVICDYIKISDLKGQTKKDYEHYQGVKMDSSGQYVIVQPLIAYPGMNAGDEYKDAYEGGGIVFEDDDAVFSPDAPPNEFIYSYALTR